MMKLHVRLFIANNLEFFLGILLFFTRLLPDTKITDKETHPRLLQIYQKGINILRLFVNSMSFNKREGYALQYLIPIINYLFDKNYVNFAQYTLLSLEEWLLSKKTEKEFENVLQLFKDHAISAGERFRDLYPPPLKETAVPLKISFTSYWAAKSGAEVIMGLANYFSSYDVYFHTLKVFDNREEVFSFKESCNKNGIKLILPTENSTLYDVFALRNLFIESPVDIALWQMPPFHMFFFFAFGLAKKQIFFSQYLRPSIDIKYVDDRLTLGGTGFKTQKSFNNRMWNIVPQVTKIQGINDSAVILFTPARLEKLKQPEFLNSVVKILKAAPNTIFKWTGYHKDKETVDFFKKHKLETRHQYIHWLDNKSLIEEIKSSTVILACYPLSLGTVELMAAFHNIPIVSMYDEECNLYWRDIYWEAINGNEDLRGICLDKNGNSHILMPRTSDEYVEAALKVISDTELSSIYTEVYNKAYKYAYLDNKNDVQKIFDGFVYNLYCDAETKMGINKG
jgi:hypothetical protein